MTKSRVLTVADLSVDYQVGRSVVPSLRRVGLTLDAGEVLGIVGESGSGKSTLVASVLGLLPSNATVRAGSIAIDGTEMVGADIPTRQTLRRGRLGMIPQNPITSLDPTRKVELAFRDVGVDEAGAQALLASVGFPTPDDVLDSYPHQLSGGMAQRVAIALAVARNPALLVADEPTSALDADVADSVLAVLVNLARHDGRGLLIVTHDLSIVSKHCDSVVVMSKGTVVESGSVADVMRSPTEEYTRALLSASRDLHAEERPPRRLTTEVAVELRDASVSYASGPPWAPARKKALDAVSLTIHRGEMVGLVGASGSGKSTISQLVLGLQKPDHGSVLIDSRPIRSPRRGTPGSVQVVLQHPDWALNPALRVGTSVGEPLAILGGVSRKDAAARVKEMLERVGLDPSYADRHPHELSGGQRQRASIARALIARPNLIVFDEAVSSLDVSVQAQVLRVISEVQHDLGFSGLFISHDAGAVAYISDRVVHLDHGRIVDTTTPMKGTPA